MPSLPAGFEEMMHGLGGVYAGTVLSALKDTPAQVSIRANVLKGCHIASGVELVPWWPDGCYLPERPLFVADPAWHQGLYYVQDASSMVYSTVVRRIVGDVIGTDAPLRYLDACAAPGGKTIAALEVLPAGSLVVANEADGHRANILLENLAKCGSADVIVSRGDARRYERLAESFDIIAVDAPCSGEGMMRKDADAVAQWSPGLVRDCAALQRSIVSSLWQALRPGGVMIYSTCTFNRSENEENVRFIAQELGGSSLELGLDSYDGVLRGIGTPYCCYRFAPGLVRGEGLFVAALRKPGTLASAADDDGYVARKQGDMTILLPKAHIPLVDKLSRTVKLIRAGLPLTHTKGRDEVPAHELALSLCDKPYPRLDVDHGTALSYLRGESLTDIPSDVPKGFVLLYHGGHPLGFVKNIGRRANNLLPEIYRIRLDARRLESETNIPLLQ